MRDTEMITYLRLAPRFLRSTDLTRDFHDTKALSGYCLTDFAGSCLARVAEGIRQGSGRRAWRITGDYGSGKSSFALLLASSFTGEHRRLPHNIFRQVTKIAPEVLKAKYIPLLVVGSRQPMAKAVLEKLQSLVENALPGKTGADLLQRIRSEFRTPTPSDDTVVDILSSVSFRLIKTRQSGGLLVILDEVGKFLEYAATNSNTHDIFFLQKLAETASRSGDAPVLLVCLLHQGFNAYADQLTQSSQREWEKIAGRLEEITFNHPLDQVLLLVESSLSVKVEALPPVFRNQAVQTMEKAIKLGWYGSASNRQTLSKHASGIFPIDPFVLPVLLRTFHRFGQNERSLFSFIYSFEPFGLRSFATRSIIGAEPYRLYDFYDYVRTNFGHRLAVISYRSRWSVIESMIESFPTIDPCELRILKTVGILNLINADDLLPTEERLVWAIAGHSKNEQHRVVQTIKRLRKRGILHFRGTGRGYCLWPYTSVDIEKAFDEARRQVPSVVSVPQAITDQLDARPIVARRHYIETGNLRYFSVNYCSVDDLSSVLNSCNTMADGRIVVPLCETDTECNQAKEIARTFTANTKPILIAISQPLEKLKGLILEAQRWDWVSMNTPELNADPYAREEVSRYRTYAQQTLQDAIQDYVGLTRLTAKTSLAWFHNGKEQHLSSGREVLIYLSRLCKDVYNQAPILKNELVNRHTLSAAAAAARMRLIDAMFMKPHEELLGMPKERKPPEMSMYLSVLKASGMHCYSHGEWYLDEPPKSDPCQLRPAFNKIRQIIESQPDTRVSIQSLFAELRNPPYGLRDGIIPILLAVVAIAYEQEVALYENGTFLREVGKDAFLRMTKAPQSFDIQYCKVEGIRSKIFSRLAKLLGVTHSRGENPELLDVVKELCVFVAQLPEYARNTKRLPSQALAVRDAILNAREPIQLIFHDLPAACSVQDIPHGTTIDRYAVEQLVDRTKDALERLRHAFAELQGRMRNAITADFALKNTDFSSTRREIAKRAEQLLIDVTEPKLKTFCFRLLDQNLVENDWLESLGSYLALRPPSKWRDEDEDLFDRERSTMIIRFRHSEAALFGRKGKPNAVNLMRLSLTKATGQERQEILSLPANEQKKANELKKCISQMIEENGHVAVAAVSQALWDHLPNTEDSDHG